MHAWPFLTYMYSGTSQLRPPVGLPPSGLNSEVVLILKLDQTLQLKKYWMCISCGIHAWPLVALLQCVQSQVHGLSVLFSVQHVSVITSRQRKYKILPNHGSLKRESAWKCGLYSSLYLTCCLRQYKSIKTMGSTNWCAQPANWQLCPIMA